MRIIIASQTYTYGNGQASFTIRLAENLSARGHQVMVLTPSEKMSAYGTTINGVRVEMVPAIHLSILHPSFYLTPFPVPRIRQLFDEFQPELVHIQDHYFLCSAVVNEARRRGLPTMGTNHFLPENLLPFFRDLPALQHLATIPLWKMMLDVFNRLDLATTPSKTAARILRGQKIYIPVRPISNGVDTIRFHPDPTVDRVGVRRKYNLHPEKPLFLYMGRLDGEKRLDVLIKAVSLLKDIDDFQFAIGGYGLYETFLRNQVHELGLDDRITFIGYVTPEDLPSLLNSSDIFVMPSPEELQSIATLEAMACGKPILAANARALPELVASGENGYLFQPNDPSDAARMMRQFLQEKENWSKMGQASFERVQVHSLENTLVRYEEQYKWIMEKVPVKQQPGLTPRKATRKYYWRSGM
jgi:1,2-diacylglycerol 3-alpha-glucosyltransferase